MTFEYSDDDKYKIELLINIIRKADENLLQMDLFSEALNDDKEDDKFKTARERFLIETKTNEEIQKRVKEVALRRLKKLQSKITSTVNQ